MPSFVQQFGLEENFLRQRVVSLAAYALSLDTGVCQASQHPATRAGTFARAIDGHQGTVSDLTPITPHRIGGAAARHADRWHHATRPGASGECSPSRRYLKSVSGVYDVARRAFELRRGRVILIGVYDAG
jgi:hypothetical protein